MKTYEYKLLASNIGLVYQFIWQLFDVSYLINLEQVPKDIIEYGYYEFFAMNKGVHRILITRMLELYHIQYITTVEWKFPVQQAMLIERSVSNDKQV